MKFASLAWPVWLVFLNTYLVFADSFTNKCAEITSHLNIENSRVWFSSYVTSGTNLTLPDNNVTCGVPYQLVSADICRVALTVYTSQRSQINMEAWLPRNWTGRFLSTGNGGLGGCISYGDMAYATALGFATVGANNGHNGSYADALLNHPESVTDFAYRSVHTGVVIGKQISNYFYSKPYTKSYYFGCSSGGRQGFKEIQDFPNDFDGVVSGAPALAWNNLTSWGGHFYPLTGNASSPRFILASLWSLVGKDVLKQCDGLDGAVDGIIETAVYCNYTPDNLICGPGETGQCLTEEQAKTVRKIYSPLFDDAGNFVYPRMQPGTEETAPFIYYGGGPTYLSSEWFQFVIYNDPNWDPATLGSKDYNYAWTENPFNINTWNGDMGPFRNNGGKVITYHGQMDSVISSGISEVYYNHVASSMRASPRDLDEFYRFFRIGGMNHCALGPGAWNFGQSGVTPFMDADHNVLLAIVRWVEQGIAPDSITGTKYVNDTASLGVQFQRRHCRYPLHNVHAGGDPEDPNTWQCVP